MQYSWHHWPIVIEKTYFGVERFKSVRLEMLYRLCQRGTKTQIFVGKGYVKSLFNSGLVRTNLSFSHRFNVFSHPLYEHKLHCFDVINYIALGNKKKRKSQ